MTDARAACRGSPASLVVGGAVLLGMVGLSASVAGCAHGEPTPESRFEELARDVEISRDPALDALAPEVAEAWKHYGAVKLAIRMDLKEQGLPHNPFLAEYEARRELVRHWRECRPPPGLAGSRALDDLVQLDERGLLDEYVLLHFAEPGWRVTLERGVKIDVGTYNTFLGSGVLEDHEPWRPFRFDDKGGHGALTPAGAPRVKLKSPLLDDASSCGDLVRTLPAVVRDTETALAAVRAGGAHPLAADTSAELIHALAALQDEGGEAAVVAEWVHPQTYEVLFVFGFCLVELERAEEAVGPLRGAVELAPVDEPTRLELAQALIRTGALDEAYALAERIARRSDLERNRGGALRTMGYIEIERGQLDRAEATFRAALRAEPGHPMALSELDYIAELRGADGTPEAGGRVEPPLGPDMRQGAPVRSLRELMEEAARQTDTPRGVLFVTTEPPGAEVVLDGRVLGATPLRFAGIDPTVPHRLEVRRAGEEPVEVELEPEDFRTEAGVPTYRLRVGAGPAGNR